MGASSFSPSPMTTTPFIDTVETSWRIALTAAPSAPFLSPRPTHRPAAIAAASVTRTSSSARLRSGCSPPTRSEPGTLESGMSTSYPRPCAEPCEPIVATAGSEQNHGDLGRLDARPHLVALGQGQVGHGLRRDLGDDPGRAGARHPDA